MTLPVLYMRRVKEAFEDLCIYLYIRTYWTHYGISFRLHLLIAGVNTEGHAYSLSGIYHSHFHSTCIIIFYSNHSADLEIWTDILTYRMYWRMPVISMNVSISLRIVRERDRVHGQSSPSSMQRKQKKKERVEKEKKTRRFYIVYLVMVLLYERIGSKQWSLSNRKKDSVYSIKHRTDILVNIHVYITLLFFSLVLPRHYIVVHQIVAVIRIEYCLWQRLII